MVQRAEGPGDAGALRRCGGAAARPGSRPGCLTGATRRRDDQALPSPQRAREVSREEGPMSSSSESRSVPEGPGSVSGAPNLPEGFTDMFTSRYIDAGDVRLHAVIGGEGPPLVLVHGWPQNWYAWRMVMPQLARDFEVIAPDQRGIGLSDKPEGRYDPATLANDLVALMDALGHERFAVVGDRKSTRLNSSHSS